MTAESLGDEGLGWLLETGLLGRLKQPYLDRCLAVAQWRTCEREQFLTRAGGTGEGVHIVVSGQAVVRSASRDGAFETVAHVGPGMVLGERSMVKGVPQAFDVVASSKVRTLHIPEQGFRQLYDGVADFRRCVDGLVALRERWDQLVQLVSRNPFLRSLGMEDVERLLQSAELITFDRGGTVVTAGDASTDVFLVIRGRLGVFGPGAKGDPRAHVADSIPGDLVGHAAVLLEHARTADVMALEESEVLRFEALTFMDTVVRNPLVQRQLLQYLARMDMPHMRANAAPARRSLVMVSGVERSLGATTIAYGLAGVLRSIGEPMIIDADGQSTARRLGLKVRCGKRHGIAVHEMEVPASWRVPVIWPQSMGDLHRLLTALRAEGGMEKVDSPVLVSVAPRTQAYDEALSVCEAAVFVRRASDRLSDMPARRGMLRYQAIRLEKGVSLPLATSRKAARIPLDQTSVDAFWLSGQLEHLTSPTSPFGRACARLSRLLRGRSVGVALGGGGALGFAHVGLLRVLEQAGIPVDFVSGVSFGSLVGALYVGGGLRALGELVKHRFRLTGYVGLSVLTTRVYAAFVNSVVGKQHLGETEIPFYPVGLDLSSGREYVLSKGTLGLAVRSSSCLPGVFPALNLGPVRLVDGGLVNNVPASVIWEAGADFIVGSNIIPSNPEGSRPPLGSRKGLGMVMGGLARLDDTIRSLYMFMSQTGRDRSLMADFIFDLHLEGYNIYDFPAGPQIAEAGRKQAEHMLSQIVRAYDEDNNIRF